MLREMWVISDSAKQFERACLLWFKFTTTGAMPDRSDYLLNHDEFMERFYACRAFAGTEFKAIMSLEDSFKLLAAAADAYKSRRPKDLEDWVRKALHQTLYQGMDREPSADDRDYWSRYFAKLVVSLRKTPSDAANERNACGPENP